MSNYDQVRAMRERQFEAKAKRALGTAQPEPVTKRNAATKPNVTKSRGGRPCIGERAMTAAERQRRHRAKPQPGSENAQ
jgi:hypothetical protein